MTEQEFSKYMNSPIEYTPTQDEIECILKIKSILSNGKTAVIKRKTDGTMVVYEEMMKKYE